MKNEDDNIKLFKANKDDDTFFKGYLKILEKYLFENDKNEKNCSGSLIYFISRYYIMLEIFPNIYNVNFE